jgi:hypothetical protein
MQSEDFQSMAVNSVNEADKHARYHQMIVDMNIDMPEEMEGDMMAVLNHGGLNAEQSEAVALLLIHAPMGENPHLINNLGMADKQELISEVQAGYAAGNLDLKFLGLGAKKEGRRLQASGTSTPPGSFSPNGGTGPSSQIIIMNTMNKVLSALTSDFQLALNNTGYFTLA